MKPWHEGDRVVSAGQIGTVMSPDYQHGSMYVAVLWDNTSIGKMVLSTKLTAIDENGKEVISD